MTVHDRRIAPLLAIIFLGPFLTFACGKTVGETINDATITTHVKTALLNDPDLGAERIDVTTADAIVTLSGTVRSAAEADHAVQIAQRVAGVKDVKSNLRVSREPQ